jgi:hypothetical protein
LICRGNEDGEDSGVGRKINEGKDLQQLAGGQVADQPAVGSQELVGGHLGGHPKAATYDHFKGLSVIFVKVMRAFDVEIEG